MELQTLVFNTTTKTVKVKTENGTDFYYENVPTVKVKPEGFYEVIQKEISNSGLESNYPVARFPIMTTNMIIER